MNIHLEMHTHMSKGEVQILYGNLMFRSFQNKEDKTNHVNTCRISPCCHAR